MTTELVKQTEQNSAILSADGALSGALSSHIALSLPALNAPLFGTDKPQAYKGYHQPERQEMTGTTYGAAYNGRNHHDDGRQRCLNATIGLLNHAYRMISQAEATIRTQNERIAKLETLATTDELTGIQNRRGFFDAFSAELDRCERNLSKGGLLMLIDLDNFKTINDTHGHQAGDASLRLIARTLQNEIRIMDTAARLGGDEFVLILSNTDRNDIVTRAQALAWQLNHLSLAWYGEEIPVRASLGLQPYKAGDDMDKIFNAADAALYADKFRRKRARTA